MQVYLKRSPIKNLQDFLLRLWQCNLYITKSSVQLINGRYKRKIFFASVVVKHVEKNLDQEPIKFDGLLPRYNFSIQVLINK